MADNNRDTKEDHSLSSRALVGFVWLFSGSVSQSVIRLLILSVLARILTPNDFGIMGACLLIYEFVNTFSEMGIAPAIIQKEKLSEKDTHTGLVISLVLSVLMTLGVYLSAPLLADFFKNDELTLPIQAISLCFPIVAIGAVSRGLLLREFKFKQLAFYELYGYIFGYALITILLSYFGFGYWSLILGQIAQFAVSTAITAISVRKSLGFAWNGDSARELTSFGVGVTWARFSNFLAMNGDNFVVGRALGTIELGLYARAFNLTQQPVKTIATLGNQVLFPIFSSVQKDEERISKAFVACKLLVFTICAPSCVGLFFLADDIVAILLGPQWGAVVLPFQILCMALPFRIGQQFNDTVLRSSGRVKSLALLQTAYAVCVILLAYIGHFWGIDGVASGVSIAIFFFYFIGAGVVMYYYRFNASLLLKIILFNLSISVIVSVLLYFLVSYSGSNVYSMPIRLIVSALVILFSLLLTGIYLEKIFGEPGLYIRSMFYKKISKFI